LSRVRGIEACHISAISTQGRKKKLNKSHREIALGESALDQLLKVTGIEKPVSASTRANQIAQANSALARHPHQENSRECGRDNCSDQDDAQAPRERTQVNWNFPSLCFSGDAPPLVFAHREHPSPCVQLCFEQSRKLCTVTIRNRFIL
jgi:hypothetical protein